MSADLMKYSMLNDLITKILKSNESQFKAFIHIFIVLHNWFVYNSGTDADNYWNLYLLAIYWAHMFGRTRNTYIVYTIQQSYGKTISQN